MVLLLHKKFTWSDFGRVYIPIYPGRYAPANIAHQPNDDLG